MHPLRGLAFSSVITNPFCSHLSQVAAWLAPITPQSNLKGGLVNYLLSLRRWIVARIGGGKGILGGSEGAGGGLASRLTSRLAIFCASQSSALVTVSPILVSGNFISPMLKSVRA